MSQLRTERLSLRLSQDEAAERLGVKTGTWRKWEAGTRNMPEPKLRLWARIALEIAADTVVAAKRIREGIQE